ncbi:hypothetical protein BOTBODRAFT_57568 [Botryobasidium botryosum FD-172 SS1]|uniref:MYND-type domain-containing protein n=1 Tax=Botryobasidium botryosum (strain FD-172 SS1) TaxID=930990 RepID=A0A067MH69_BOTB1|nr:hypothetical protein BOTBODRAFT_57568 [Botryobasidium botryosum FD-172 SS1]
MAASNPLDQLAEKLSHLSTTEEKEAAVSTVLGDAGPFDLFSPTSFLDDIGRMMDLLKQHGLAEPNSLERIYRASEAKEKGGRILMPHNRAPCANVNPAKAWGCPNEGKLACGRCKLVGYCSKACQTSHWRTHKSDCNDPIRSPDWSPAWVLEGRSPSFMGGNANEYYENWVHNLDKLAIGLHLWGNVPAIDVLNLSRNERTSVQDFSLAFIASGDIRNVVRTINELPPDYSGKINILLNDREPIIVLRNLVLLLLCGGIFDKAHAAELALHFWYSAFVPINYAIQLQPFVASFAQHVKEDMSFSLPLNSRSTMSGALTPSVLGHLFTMLQSKYGISEANQEINRVRFAPSRQDRHHRQYCRLEPSHRLAFLEYRRFGLVLPFGARNDHFSHPNQLLFSSECEWLQDDLANPLESWDIPSVVAAGKAYGALRADIYGCLYFYLSDQLRSFAERVGRFQINFQLFCQDASVLSDGIRSGAHAQHGVPATRLYDRIDVSNILDAEYLGIPRVLADWSPLLRKSETATVVGYCMNWSMQQAGGSINTAGKGVIGNLAAKLMKQGRIYGVSNTSSVPSVSRTMRMTLGYLNSMNAMYESSGAFEEYLEKKGMAEALHRTKLKRKQKHTIVPHRLCGPLDGPPSALPLFPDEESWYLNTCVGFSLWTERFLEFSHA